MPRIDSLMSRGLVLALCASCAASADVVPAPETGAACPVIESRDWAAWINKMPGPESDGPPLHVTGTVTLPTPGYDLTYSAGPLDRSMRPMQHINLQFTPPDGMVVQMIAEDEVHITIPAASAQYRGVTLHCGDQVLAEIGAVESVY
ncbi:hypothetical protein ACJ5NV_02110 [Loktanella agnita]|uniref:hypothetical protein n=1 Tax=Loktanella agnita TaxID=287097 RepID=UPI0039883E50